MSITSIGKHTERIKAILRREGLNIYRKGGEKLEWEVKKKKKTEKKKGISSDNKEEGAVYQIKCKDCEKIKKRETQFKISKRIGQHRKTYNIEGRIVRLLNMHWN